MGAECKDGIVSAAQPCDELTDCEAFLARLLRTLALLCTYSSILVAVVYEWCTAVFLYRTGMTAARRTTFEAKAFSKLPSESLVTHVRVCVSVIFIVLFCSFVFFFLLTQQ